jgi:hypothetical protein
MSSLHKEFELAEALEQALAKRGSVSAVLDYDVAELVDLARTLQDTATRVAPSDEFRARSRQRLLAWTVRSARQQAPSPPPTLADRVRQWVVRAVAVLLALGATGFAAASASASALPGDPLYPVKHVTEAVALQLAQNDSARQHLMLQQADTRLDETARLLQQGRDTDAAVTAARYDDTLAALAVSEPVQSQLDSNEARLNQLLESAPPAARPGLEGALAATERGLNRGRSTPSGANPDETGASPTPVAHPSRRPSEAADPEPTAVRPSEPADAGEHGHARKDENTAASHRDDLHDRAQPTPFTIEPDSPPANGSSTGSDPPPTSDDRNPATRADAHATPASKSAATSLGNAPARLAQQGRTGPQTSGVTRPAPAGRGRP